MTEAPRLPASPLLVSSADLIEGSEDGAWTDALVQAQRLNGITLDDARFVDCRFDGCDLAGARFSRLVLRRVEFVGCRLTGIDLGAAQLHDVRFSACKLDEANLRGTKGERVTFDDDTMLTGTEFALADLVDVVFSASRLDGVDFRRAVLRGATFPECDLTDVLGVDGLKDAHLTRLQALQLAPRLAAQLGIRILDDD